MTDIIRVERGWPGHYCRAIDCLFRRNTLLSKDNRHIVISTVGKCRNRETNKIDNIGLTRYYETMAFIGKSNGSYIDADIHRELETPPIWTIDAIEEYSDSDADEMHEAAVDYYINLFDIYHPSYRYNHE